MAWCRQQQAITWANVDPDLCRHMVLQGHNELIKLRANRVHICLNALHSYHVSSDGFRSSGYR